jgi:hypothetical protein
MNLDPSGQGMISVALVEHEDSHSPGKLQNFSSSILGLEESGLVAARVTPRRPG